MATEMATEMIGENSSSPYVDKKVDSSEETTTTADDTVSVGTKAYPVCVHPVMTKESMSTDELVSLSFPSNFSLDVRSLCGDDVAFTHSHLEYASINDSVQSLKVSREGRHTQRWETDPQSNNVTRLVVGCIPILRGEKILLVSASKKPQWILPKGGWELDESMEESAIRETFEEAGVVGFLGPKLSEIHYEKRKAKRKLSFEDKIKKSTVEITERQFSSGSSGWSDLTVEDSSVEIPEVPSVVGVDLGKTEDIAPSEKVASNDEMSTASPIAYSHVRLTLFPLYVTEIKDAWPEDGRIRTAMDIDEALTRLEGRPEMWSFLSELKSKKLHVC